MSLDRVPDIDAARAAALAFLPEHEATAVASEHLEHEKNSANDDGAGAEHLAAMVGMLLDKVALSVALRWGDHWKLDAGERDAIAGPLTEIAERELGKMGDTPEDRLLLAVGVYAVPRLLLSIAAPATSPASAETLNVSGERVA